MACGDQLYAYRGHYADDDDSTDTTYGGGDKVCRRIIYDADGRQRAVIGCTPGDNYLDAAKTTYVVKAEVKEGNYWPVSDHRRYDSPPLKKAAEHYRRPESPAGYVDRGRRPQEVDEFLTAIQIEASRVPPVHSGGGFGRNGNSQIYSQFPKPQYQNYRDGNNYGGAYDSDDEFDDEDDDYYYDGDRYDGGQYKPSLTTTKPVGPTDYGGWGSASAPVVSHGAGKLGMPTSNIDEALEYLKGTARPVYGSKYEAAAAQARPEPQLKPYAAAYNGSAEASKPYGTKYGQQINISPSAEAVKPYVGSYGSGDVARPYGTAGKLYGTGTATSEPVKPYVGNYGGGDVAKPYGTAGKLYGTGTATSEAVKPYVGNYGGGDVAKPYGTAGKLYGTGTATSEAVKPYVGNYGGGDVAKPYGTAGKFFGTGTASSVASSTASSTSSTVIDCYEAARRYNGKVIRTG